MEFRQKRFYLLQYLVSCAFKVWNSLCTCTTISRESPWTCSAFTPTSATMFIPAIRASYSASLLLVLKANLRESYNWSSSWPSSVTPAPLPLLFDDPSIVSIYGIGLGSLNGSWSVGGISSMKSAST